MGAMARVAIAVLTSLATWLPAAAAAQTPPAPNWWTVDLTKAVAKLTAAAENAGVSRVAVPPVVTSDRAMAHIADDVREHLVSDIRTTAGARVQVVDAGGTKPSGYAIAGTLQQSHSGLPSKIDLELRDLAAERVIERASAAFTFPDAPGTTPDPPFVSKRLLIAGAGAAAAAAAAFTAIHKDRDLQAKKIELAAVPAGLDAEWNRIHDEAEGISKDRDFWWGVSIGVSAVTVSYLILKKGPATNKKVPSVVAKPASGQVQLVWAF